MTGFKLDAQQVLKGLANVDNQVHVNTRALGNKLAREYTRDAQNGAPWTDHTHKARGTLAGKAQTSGARTTVTYSSGAYYQEYLEFGHGERFAIVYPLYEKSRAQLTQLYGSAALGGGVDMYRDKRRKR